MSSNTSRRYTYTTPASSSSAFLVPPEEPMQSGYLRLTLEEHQRRVNEGRCIYCAQKEHFLASSLVKEQAHP